MRQLKEKGWDEVILTTRAKLFPKMVEIYWGVMNVLHLVMNR